MLLALGAYYLNYLDCTMEKISPSFLLYASDILADTDKGLSGGWIVKIFNSKSVEYGIEVPHYKIPFAKGTPNKRTAFLQNIEKFSPEQQFAIIDACLMNERFLNNEDAKTLKIKLYGQYKHLAIEGLMVTDFIFETKHWLQQYTAAFKLYSSALEKYAGKVYQRNLLDDLRLSLELLLKQILQNDKSLENQLGNIGTYQKAQGMSPEVMNMFTKLVDYYGKYQNNYVKHNDDVKSSEIEFIIDLTSTFMRFLIRGHA